MLRKNSFVINPKENSTYLFNRKILNFLLDYGIITPFKDNTNKPKFLLVNPDFLEEILEGFGDIPQGFNLYRKINYVYTKHLETFKYKLKENGSKI